MNRSTLRKIGFVFASAAIGLWPHAAGAQSLADGATTVDQVRSGFINQGYQLEAPTTWWTNDRVTTFRVSDSASGRVLMVLVYPDQSTAEAERAKIQSDEVAGGARLVPGYGLSTWRGNIAFVESTTADLRRQYTAELELDNHFGAADPQTAQPPEAQPTNAVDLDFLNVIDAATANL